MRNRKETNLRSHLEQGKVIGGTLDFLNNEGRLLTTMVCIRKTDKELFEVELESFYADVDVRDLNIRDDIKIFLNLEEALSFIKNETSIDLSEMHAF